MPEPVKIVFLINCIEVPRKFSGPRDAPVKSNFLTTISHLGPAHLQRVSASLYGRLDCPIYPSLVIGQYTMNGHDIPSAHQHISKIEIQLPARRSTVA